MEKKYGEFLQYNWNESEEWKSYFNNLYPTPDSREKVMHFRKRFYKLKVDPEFDEKYAPEFEKKFNDYIGNHKHHENCSHGIQEDKNVNPTQKKGVVDTLTAAIEAFLWVAFLFNILIRVYLIRLCMIALIFRFFRDFGIKSLNKDIFKNDIFQLFLFAFLLNFGTLGYLIVFPLSVFGLYCICDYFANYLRIFQFCKQYFEMISNKKDYMDSLRGFSFWFLAIYLVFCLVIGWNSFIFCLAYWIYLRTLFVYNKDIQNSFYGIKKLIDGKIKSTATPKIIQITYEKIIKLF